MLKKLTSLTLPFGDHLMISFEINSNQSSATVIYGRNWQNYTKESLQHNLSLQNRVIENNDVQGYWNSLESTLVTIIDELAPLQCLPDKLNVREKTPKNNRKQNQ